MKKPRKRLYEGMYILSATLSDDARQKALDKICHAIEEKGGEIHKIHLMGRRHLAYEIGKKREGYYHLVYFSIDSLLEKELWKEYHLHEDLIRFFTLRADKILETLEFKPLKEQD